ncbi:hypothetical protein B296_00035471 [Ensete ventricosum]|uniref:Uncharacterized protein n=1 Tax=Ensete ventricosum TaxID=4639 RepID=A0A426XN84_ENSVE|nr:hypothetical protein B296_00035471 [Ensete ventricosum]
MKDPQPADCTTHALAGYANPQAAKVEESFKQQPVTVLTNNLMNDKGEQCSQISSYFHDFSNERTIMLKVFPDDDDRSMAHDRKKIKSPTTVPTWNL